MALFPPAPGGGSGVAHGYKGKGTLIHLLVDKRGHPICATTTAANGDERKQVMPLLKCFEKLPVRNRKIMIILEADGGYDANWLRAKLFAKNIFPCIPYRQIGKPSQDRPPRKKVLEFFKIKSVRWVVERAFSWLKRRCRRLMQRWERLLKVWESFVTMGLIYTWMLNLSG